MSENKSENMETKEDTGYLKCPKCKSTALHQISAELITYDLQKSRIVHIKWDSEYQLYECQDCGYETDDLKEIEGGIKK